MSRNPTIAVGKPIKQGRPEIPFYPEYCELLIKHMSDGFSFESFGAHVENGVSKDTLYRWVDKYPDFCEAKKVGEIKSRHWWEHQGHEGMAGLIPGFNSTVYIFSMKNKFGYRDKVELDASMTTNNITTNVNIEVNATVEELSKELRKLLDVSKEAEQIKDVTPQRIKLKQAD